MSFCRALRFALALLLLGLLPGSLCAKTIRHYDQNGRSTGRATTSSDGTVRYYDQNGRSTGRTNGTLSPAQAGNPARR